MLEVMFTGLIGGVIIVGFILIRYFFTKIFFPTPKLKDMDIKYDYLLDHYKRLVGTIDVDKKKEIVDIQVHYPGPNKIWSVKKYIKKFNPFMEESDEYNLFKIDDEKLSTQISLINTKEEVKNKKKKHSYLLGKYKSLIGTKDEELKKEIIDIQVNTPGVSKVWSVDKYVKNKSIISGEYKERYELSRINDNVLDDEMKN